MKGFILGVIAVLAVRAVVKSMKIDKETVEETVSVTIEKTAELSSKAMTWVMHNEDKVEAIGMVVSLIIDVMSIRNLLQEKRNMKKIDDIDAKLDQLLLVTPTDYSAAY